MAKRGRPPKAEKTVKPGVLVRLPPEDLETIRQAISKELEGVTGATISVPRFMAAAAMEKARKILAGK